VAFIEVGEKFSLWKVPQSLLKMAGETGLMGEKNMRFPPFPQIINMIMLT